MRLSLVLLVAALPACAADSVTGYADLTSIYRLESIDGQPFRETATIAFPEPGRIAGQAPCNRWFGALAEPYPAFGPGPIGATRMACPDLDAEQAFFDALAAMTTASAEDGVLTLTGADGGVMVFRAQP